MELYVRRVPQEQGEYPILLARPVSCLHYFVSPIFVYAGLIRPLYKNAMHIRFCVWPECIQEKM
jgi:hypothetical protein